jgi:hypothetical protein
MSITHSPSPRARDCGYAISNQLADVVARLGALEELTARHGFPAADTVRLELWTARRAVERAAADADARIARARARMGT